MGNAIFPAIAGGLSWTVSKTPTHKTLIQESTAAGYDTRVLLAPDPIWKLKLEYVILYGDQRNTIKQLESFFNLRHGNYDSFRVSLANLTKNNNDSTVTGQLLVPDASGYAPLAVASQVGGEIYSENIYELNGTPQLYMAGGSPPGPPILLVPGTDYNIIGPGVALPGVTYPGLVAQIIKTIAGPITANFSWYYRMRFEQSEQELEQFLYLLWRAKTVQLIGSRT